MGDGAFKNLWILSLCTSLAKTSESLVSLFEEMWMMEQKRAASILVYSSCLLFEALWKAFSSNSLTSTFPTLSNRKIFRSASLFSSSKAWVSPENLNDTYYYLAYSHEQKLVYKFLSRIANKRVNKTSVHYLYVYELFYYPTYHKALLMVLLVMDDRAQETPRMELNAEIILHYYWPFQGLKMNLHQLGYHHSPPCILTFFADDNCCRCNCQMGKTHSYSSSEHFG